MARRACGTPPVEQSQPGAIRLAARNLGAGARIVLRRGRLSAMSPPVSVGSGCSGSKASRWPTWMRSRCSRSWLRRHRRTVTWAAAVAGWRSRAEVRTGQNRRGQMAQSSWIRQSRTGWRRLGPESGFNRSSPRRSRRERPSSSSRAGGPSAASKRQVSGPQRQRLRRGRWGHGQRVAPDRPRRG